MPSIVVGKRLCAQTIRRFPVDYFPGVGPGRLSQRWFPPVRAAADVLRADGARSRVLIGRLLLDGWLSLPEPYSDAWLSQLVRLGSTK